MCILFLVLYAVLSKETVFCTRGHHGEYNKILAIKLYSTNAKLAIEHFPYLSGEYKQYYGSHHHLYVKYTTKSPNPFHIDNMEAHDESRHAIGYLGYDITIYQSAERFHSHHGKVQHRVKCFTAMLITVLQQPFYSM